MSLDALETLLYRRSGLLALSGVSSDMQTLEQSDDEACRFAIEHFCYWAARHAASLAVALGGVDSIAFTAGIGVHSARVRREIVGQLRWLDLAIDDNRNARHAEVISTDDSRCPVWVVAADEESTILRHVQKLLAQSA
jgi:acetate kinase